MPVLLSNSPFVFSFLSHELNHPFIVVTFSMRVLGLVFRDTGRISLRFGTLMRSLSCALLGALLVSGRSFCIVWSRYGSVFRSVRSVRFGSVLDWIGLDWMGLDLI